MNPNQKINRQKKEKRLALIREKKIRESRKSFWVYCKTLAPDFYKEDREFLKEYCDTLQALYEKRIIRPADNPEGEWNIVELQLSGEIKILHPNTENELSVISSGGVDYEICRKLMINLPPRFGKSRTLFMFCDWCFGQDNENRVITCSYNDVISGEFSRYTRDGISQTKNFPHEIVFRDIFPNTALKHGNAAFERWALEGQFFNYLGAGICGTITGKGCNIGIIDDTVKGAEEAYNEGYLDKIWLWYTGTFKSRPEEEAIEILPGTRWSKKDIFGRILDGPTKRQWYIFKREAMDKETGKMLCPSLMSRSRYEELKATTDPTIFEANYHQTPVDIKGRLYQNLKTYNDVPRDPRSDKPIFEKIIAYIDTADEGNDWLFVPAVGVYQGEGWLLDIYLTQEAMETTEPVTADFLVRNQVNSAKFESNNGGRGFARNVERLMWERHQTRSVNVSWFHQSENKMARILTSSSFVCNHIYFPAGWETKWPKFFQLLTAFQREGKNAFDDVPDGITGIAEMIQGKLKKVSFELNPEIGRQESGWRI